MGLAPGNDLSSIFSPVAAPATIQYLCRTADQWPWPGRLYQAPRRGPGESTRYRAPPSCPGGARGEDKLCCVLALETFCALLGPACGDFLLATGSHGGLRLGRRHYPRHDRLHRQQCFSRAHARKGAMGDILSGVPVHIITTGQPGLIGAAHAPWALNRQGSYSSVFAWLSPATGNSRLTRKPQP